MKKFKVEYKIENNVIYEDKVYSFCKKYPSYFECERLEHMTQYTTQDCASHFYNEFFITTGDWPKNFAIWVDNGFFGNFKIFLNYEPKFLYLKTNV